MYDTVIIVPYRNRPTQLEHFINVIAPRIHSHIPNSKVVIVEQYGNKLFNRGKLINVGCLEYKNKTKSFIIHDVDLEPDDFIVNKFYKPPLDIKANEHVRGLYNNKFRTLGGIYKIDHDVYFNVNGHHNKIWGWGLEDQDFKNRMNVYNYNVNYTTIRMKETPTPHFKNINDVQEESEEKIYNKKKSRFFYKAFRDLHTVEQLKWIQDNGITNMIYKKYKSDRINSYIIKNLVII